MEKGCAARLRLKPTSGHGGTLDARVARNQPGEGRGKSSSQGDSDVRGEGNGRARANLCPSTFGGAITHAGERPLRFRLPPANQPMPTPRPAARSLPGQAGKARRGQPLRERHRPSASPSLFPPFGCAANSSSPSHVVIHAFFLRIPDRRSPPAIIYTVNKSPPKGNHLPQLAGPRQGWIHWARNG